MSSTTSDEEGEIDESSSPIIPVTRNLLQSRNASPLSLIHTNETVQPSHDKRNRDVRHSEYASVYSRKRPRNFFQTNTLRYFMQDLGGNMASAIVQIGQNVAMQMNRYLYSFQNFFADQVAACASRRKIFVPTQLDVEQLPPYIQQQLFHAIQVEVEKCGLAHVAYSTTRKASSHIDSTQSESMIKGERALPRGSSPMHNNKSNLAREYSSTQYSQPSLQEGTAGNGANASSRIDMRSSSIAYPNVDARRSWTPYSGSGSSGSDSLSHATSFLNHPPLINHGVSSIRPQAAGSVVASATTQPVSKLTTDGPVPPPPPPPPPLPPSPPARAGDDTQSTSAAMTSRARLVESLRRKALESKRASEAQGSVKLGDGAPSSILNATIETRGSTKNTFPVPNVSAYSHVLAKTLVNQPIADDDSSAMEESSDNESDYSDRPSRQTMIPRIPIENDTQGSQVSTVGVNNSTSDLTSEVPTSDGTHTMPVASNSTPDSATEEGEISTAQQLQDLRAKALQSLQRHRTDRMQFATTADIGDEYIAERSIQQIEIQPVSAPYTTSKGDIVQTPATHISTTVKDQLIAKPLNVSVRMPGTNNGPESGQVSATRASQSLSDQVIANKHDGGTGKEIQFGMLDILEVWTTADMSPPSNSFRNRESALLSSQSNENQPSNLLGRITERALMIILSKMLEITLETQSRMSKLVLSMQLFSKYMTSGNYEQDLFLGINRCRNIYNASHLLSQICENNLGRTLLRQIEASIGAIRALVSDCRAHVEDKNGILYEFVTSTGMFDASIPQKAIQHILWMVLPPSVRLLVLLCEQSSPWSWFCSTLHVSAQLNNLNVLMQYNSLTTWHTLRETKQQCAALSSDMLFKFGQRSTTDISRTIADNVTHLSISESDILNFTILLYECCKNQLNPFPIFLYINGLDYCQCVSSDETMLRWIKNKLSVSRETSDGLTATLWQWCDTQVRKFGYTMKQLGKRTSVVNHPTVSTDMANKSCTLATTASVANDIKSTEMTSTLHASTNETSNSTEMVPKSHVSTNETRKSTEMVPKSHVSANETSKSMETVPKSHVLTNKTSKSMETVPSESTSFTASNISKTTSGSAYLKKPLVATEQTSPLHKSPQVFTAETQSIEVRVPQNTMTPLEVVYSLGGQRLVASDVYKELYTGLKHAATEIGVAESEVRKWLSDRGQRALQYASDIHESDTANEGPDATVELDATVKSNATVKRDTFLKPNAAVKPNATVEPDTTVKPSAVLSDNSIRLSENSMVLLTNSTFSTSGLKENASSKPSPVTTSTVVVSCASTYTGTCARQGVPVRVTNCIAHENNTINADDLQTSLAKDKLMVGTIDVTSTQSDVCTQPISDDVCHTLMSDNSNKSTSNEAKTVETNLYVDQQGTAWYPLNSPPSQRPTRLENDSKEKEDGHTKENVLPHKLDALKGASTTERAEFENCLRQMSDSSAFQEWQSLCAAFQTYDTQRRKRNEQENQIGSDNLQTVDSHHYTDHSNQFATSDVCKKLEQLEKSFSASHEEQKTLELEQRELVQNLTKKREKMGQVVERSEQLVSLQEQTLRHSKEHLRNLQQSARSQTSRRGNRRNF